jgi:hypothetical protein
MADTLDVVTLAEAEANMGDVPDDALLAVYITSVSRLLDKVCGPIVSRTVTAEPHDGWCEELFLHEYPVRSVTSVAEYAGVTATTLVEELVTTSPANGFTVDYSHGKVRRRAGKRDWYFPEGRKNVLVTYVAGRYADTASVDERFKMAAYITLRNLWQREQGMGTVTFGPDGQPLMGATFALPNAAAAFIREDMRVSGHSD